MPRELLPPGEERDGERGGTRDHEPQPPAGPAPADARRLVRDGPRRSELRVDRGHPHEDREAALLEPPPAGLCVEPRGASRRRPRSRARRESRSRGRACDGAAGRWGSRPRRSSPRPGRAKRPAPRGSRACGRLPSAFPSSRSCRGRGLGLPPRDPATGDAARAHRLLPPPRESGAGSPAGPPAVRAATRSEHRRGRTSLPRRRGRARARRAGARGRAVPRRPRRARRRGEPRRTARPERARIPTRSSSSASRPARSAAAILSAAESRSPYVVRDPASTTASPLPVPGDALEERQRSKISLQMISRWIWLVPS